jgi:uroporphyrin-III C-methyltransferase/precorrin-2 dehydrogenase/sirohydrochlorin ferrochelatase
MRVLGIPVNAVDRPELCDFFTPALVNRAPVAVAIGTEGAGPVLAQMIRARIDRMLSPQLGALAALAALPRRGRAPAAQGQCPPRLLARFLRRRAGACARQRPACRGACAADRAAGAQKGAIKGHVALVGAGPGAEDLLTLRAHRLLMEADVIVHDALVPEAVIAMGRRDAERLPVGKRKGCHSKTQSEINDLLVELAAGASAWCA